MKKVLLTTIVLTFAGSAFAADVSGYVKSEYKKAGEVKGLHSESEVTLSGSKTTSNGLTFGASYTIGFDYGSSETAAEHHQIATPGSASANPAVDLTTKDLSKKEGPSKSQYARVTSYVSGSFGKLSMGRVDVAAKTHGIGAVNAGDGANTQGTRKTDNDTLAYTSPSFNGISGAYSTTLGSDKKTSYAVKYDGKFSGVGVSVAYGKYKDDADDSKKSTGYGVKVSQGAFAGSYGVDKNDKSSEKSTRFGVEYSAGKVTVSYAQNKFKNANTKEDRIKASYTVVSGLEVYAQQSKKLSEDKKTETKTTIIGTKISF